MFAEIVCIAGGTFVRGLGFFRTDAFRKPWRSARVDSRRLASHKGIIAIRTEKDRVRRKEGGYVKELLESGRKLKFESTGPGAVR